MTSAMRRCLWTLIRTSRDMEGGSGAKEENTSGCKGDWKMLLTVSNAESL